jgi:hypothetical protein
VHDVQAHDPERAEALQDVPAERQEEDELEGPHVVIIGTLHIGNKL